MYLAVLGDAGKTPAILPPGHCATAALGLLLPLLLLRVLLLTPALLLLLLFMVVTNFGSLPEACTCGRGGDMALNGHTSSIHNEVPSEA
jgi:hypothetical protein